MELDDRCVEILVLFDVYEWIFWTMLRRMFDEGGCRAECICNPACLPGFPFLQLLLISSEVVLQVSSLSMTWEQIRLSRRHLLGKNSLSLWRRQCILQLASHQQPTSRRPREVQQRERTGRRWTSPWFMNTFWADIETFCHGDAVLRLEMRGMRLGGEVPA